jgi:N-acetylmuramic acid 6-phosphate etherase
MWYNLTEDRQGTLVSHGRVVRVISSETRGGGYAIGLKAIQHALAVFEDIDLRLCNSDSDELATAISAKIGCHFSETAGTDILNDPLARNHAQTVKVRIAGVPEVVLA